MARTVEALEAAQLSFLPDTYTRMTDLLAVYPAAYQLVEQVLDSLVASSLVGGAEEIFLTLLARGYGIERTTGESDASLRSRIREIEDAVTRPAILGAVNRILVSYGKAPAAGMIEWFEEPFLDVDETAAGDDAGGFYLGSTYISNGVRTFLVLVPKYGLGLAFGNHVDADFYLGSAHLGFDGEDPVYNSIIAEVERLRASGTIWRLVLVE